jgi:thiamine-monophosphate kinase
MTGELAFLQGIMARFGPPAPGEVWIGDDAAVLEHRPGRLLLTVDPMVEGVHFRAGLQSPADVGWKALARNVSDIAAMGGRPAHALVSLVVPTASSWDLDALYDGLVDAAAAFACPVVGGDVSGGPALVVTVTVAGWVEGEPVLRSGARLFVTRPLGRGAAGLRLAGSDGPGRDGEAAAWFRRPWPRVAEGEAARRGGCTAMLDLSDGLALDVRRVAAASAVGVVLDTVPVADEAEPQEALLGGDDYELLFAASDGDAVVAAFSDAGLPAPIEIGRCTAHVDELRLGADPLPRGGWEHRW